MNKKRVQRLKGIFLPVKENTDKAFGLIIYFIEQKRNSCFELDI